MINIAICEEDERSGRRTEKLVKEYAKLRGETHIDIVLYKSSLELLNDVENGKVYQMLFLGVDLPGLDGIGLARNLRRQSVGSALVFISSNREAAVDAFSLDAVHYLMTGYSLDQLAHAIEKAVDFTGIKRYERVVLAVKDGYRRFYLKDIMYTVGQKNMQQIVMSDGSSCDVRITGRELASMLTKNGFFIRCGCSYTVNMEYIKSMENGILEMSDGNTIAVPRRIQKEVREEIARLHEKFNS